MKPFLYLVAEDLRRKLQNDMSRTVVVFPNKRAGLFMNEYLLNLGNDEPLWAPRYMAINELFHALLPTLNVNDPIDTTLRIVELYQTQTGEEVSVDLFYGWAERILADFEDVDKNMADADSLFRNVEELKELDDVSYLEDDQVAILQRFFKDFDPKSKSEVRERFQRLWDALGPIYHELNTQLAQQHLAYEGALYRQVVEGLQSGALPFDASVDHYVFVGFNVLDRVEQELFKVLQKEGKAWFYWDYDNYYVNSDTDVHHEAGTFLRENLLMFKNELPASCYDNLSQPKELEMVVASTEAIQAQMVAPWLQENLTPDPKQTAVVLCNEGLLQPVLHALPDSVEEVNITKGFPLSHTEAVTLVEHQLTMWERQKTLLPVTEMIQRLSETVEQESRDYVNREDFSTERFEDVLQSEAWFLMFTLLNRFGNIVEKHQERLDFTLVTLRRLIRQVVRQATIPFHGEPAVGLQVMGVLETRCLDFEHIIMLSVNDGVLPKKSNDNSFIPYIIRKAYHLTTPERKTAVYAYYFYRLLQRATKVTMAYNNSTESKSTGEMSRFMTQLLIEWGQPIKHYVLNSSQLSYVKSPEAVDKPADLLKRLTKMKEGSFIVSLSPSELNVYLKCQLQFYYQHVAKIKVPDPDPDDIQPSTLGTIFHSAAEIIYKEILEHHNGTAEPEYLKKLANDAKALQRIVNEAFRVNEVEYKLLEAHVVEFYLKTLLLHDAGLGTFTVLGTEEKLHTIYNVPVAGRNVKVRIGGSIDRRDMIRLENGQGLMRIVDYKTGGLEQKAKNLEELFAQDKNQYYMLQTFTYADMVTRNNLHHQGGLAPALFFVNHAARKDYRPYLQLDKHEVLDFSIFLNDFEERLLRLLTEILDPTLKFSVTTNEKNCLFCPYFSLCYQ